MKTLDGLVEPNVVVPTALHQLCRFRRHEAQLRQPPPPLLVELPVHRRELPEIPPTIAKRRVIVAPVVRYREPKELEVSADLVRATGHGVAQQQRLAQRRVVGQHAKPRFSRLQVRLGFIQSEFVYTQLVRHHPHETAAAGHAAPALPNPVCQGEALVLIQHTAEIASHARENADLRVQRQLLVHHREVPNHLVRPAHVVQHLLAGLGVQVVALPVEDLHEAASARMPDVVVREGGELRRHHVVQPAPEPSAFGEALVDVVIGQHYPEPVLKVVGRLGV
ncbi:uncharacterized protein BcabD6B2_32860 [Babesia caballi]|uniref:Uncharacterized protein n=1 Tax=Babesia caballi TaxID=5871 RepID=A0AAV4LXI8_BABCB|nr:hypothetical protein BcabD6B2_32860 [Babesia caballi]